MLENVQGRNIVLGVSGGIAAYKSVELCRRLVDAGAYVAPIMTEDAHRFIGPVTLSALASEPVHTSLWDDASPIPHTRLGQNADVIVVAPATARVIAAYAMGLSHDVLVATLIATRAPVVLCPAMHTEMWEHPSVQHNIEVLRSRGVIIVEPQSGRLAGGDIGTGRLADTDSIASAIDSVLAASHDLSGVSVLVTAGGTREPIDAVRVIANRSSGKQGYAIAENAACRGATVTLVSTVDRPTLASITVIPVETADDMLRAVTCHSDSSDVIVMSAAVADFRPVQRSDGKIKKADGVPEIVLEKTPDILAGLGARKREGQILVGFAAETEDLIVHAQDKLVRKNLDLIVANDVSAPGVGFSHDTNAVTILGAGGVLQTVALTDKHHIASAVLDSVVELRSNHSPHK
ncbi:MAG: bifunctional phosphopantothenoylcysteine decarboxylase/phosphopantothenate--cysteine ligase CoaBC [Actinobacteria bacterium]|nr:bifunctional phosphopantothenoylcysteine decarboxylase/phosphopantothenate--cysteine ligase CoaBC [Actinomycetota bacterium]MTA53741.1 bifunctional phosphopantothenoylcysteine decarboxylase/phosphopantothenate--cysteine ligase CoaBC [Actinomycetota bacterium]